MQQEATAYLSNIKENIRFFVPHGPGFGDQVSALNIISRFYTLGFTGVIEIIAPTQGFSPEPAMSKIMKLLNVVSPPSFTTLDITWRDYPIRLISHEYFKNNFQDFPKVELGVFVGVYNFICRDFNYAPTYPEVAKVKRSLRLDPFTYVGQFDPGFDLQLEQQPQLSYYQSKHIGYRYEFPTPAMIESDLLNYAKENPLKAFVIETILKKQANNEINTFGIYGIRTDTHYSNVAQYLVELIRASLKANKGKPLTIMIMNPLTEVVWQQIQQTFPRLNFLNVSLNHTAIEHQFNSTMIMRIGDLPQSLFDTLMRKSTLPPVYEGANLSNLLREAGRFGLPCKRPGWHDVVDAAELPDALKDASICGAGSGNLVEAMKTFSHVKRLGLQGPDRVEYALSAVSTQKECHEVPAQCSFFKPLRHLDRVLAVHVEVAGRSAFCAGAERVTRAGLMHGVGMDRDKAAKVSGFLRAVFQFAWQNDSSVSAMISAACLALLLIIDALLPERQNVRRFSAGFLSLFQISRYVIGLDTETAVLFSSLALVGIVSESLVGRMADKIESQFAKPKKL